MLQGIVSKWQPRTGPDLAMWLTHNPPDKRGLAALCGIVSHMPGVTKLPIHDRFRLSTELAAAGADLALAYVEKANAAGPRTFYEPKHTSVA